MPLVRTANYITEKALTKCPCKRSEESHILSRDCHVILLSPLAGES
jgi:hypothetical protein